MKKEVPKKKHSFLRILAKILLGLVIFIILLLLFIGSPWGQGIIVNKVTSYISDKTDSKVEIENLFITPSGDIKMEGLYMEDKNGDTLVYSKELKANVPLWQLINGNGISVHDLDWTGLTANIVRKDSINGFNYQFLVDAFASADTTVTATDSTAGAMNINLGEMKFQDFDISYKDQVSGMNFIADIGLLDLKMQEMSLDSMQFQIGAARLINSDIDYSLEKASNSGNDSTAAPLPFLSFENLELQQVGVNYVSVPAGISLDMEIDQLNGEIPELDLEHQQYKIGSASVSNSKINYTLTEGISTPGDSTAAPLPVLSIKDVELKNVSGKYVSVPDGISAEADIEHLFAEIPELDMEQQIVNIKNIRLENSEIAVETSKVENSPENLAEKAVEPITQPEIFQWPDWKVSISHISLENNDVQYSTENTTSKKGNFDPNFISMEALTLVADDFYLRKGAAGIQLEKFVFVETSGLDLKQFSGNFQINEEKLNVENLNFRLNDNVLAGNVNLQYNSIADLIEHPENSRINANISTFELWLKDIFQFQPELRQNEYFLALSRKKLKGELRANGTLAHLRIPEARFSWGGSTTLNASGTIENPMDVEKINFDFPHFRMISTRNDLIQFIDEKQFSIKIPEKLALNGNFHGNPEDITADLVLETSSGNIDLNGSFTSEGQIAYDANLQVENLELGNILMNESLGNITLNLKSSGSGATLNELDATIDAEIEHFAYNNYDINNVPITGKLTDGQGRIYSGYDDENLKMDLEAFVQLDTVASTFITDFNIIGANLKALGIAKRDIRTAFHLYATFTGDAETYQANLNVNDAVAVYDNQTYLVGDVDVHAFVLPDSTVVDVNNRILQLELISNANPMATIKGFERHMDNYLTDEIRTDTVENPVVLRLRANVAQSPVLSKVILPELEEMDSVSVKVDFNEKERDLAAAIELPYINYNGSEVDSLFFYLESDKDSLAFDFGMNALTTGPLALKETHLLGNLVRKKLFLDFKSIYAGEQLVNVQSEISKNDGVFRVHLDPEELILNNNQWSIPADNAILISDKSMEFSDFQLSRNEQLIYFDSSLAEAEKEHIGISFENFNLQSLLSYFNPERLLAAGTMDGTFIIEEPFKKTGLIADLEIEDFSVMAVPLGHLSLDAEAIGSQEYSLDLALNGGNVNMDLTGSYVAQETSALLDLNMDLHELKMQAVEDFIPEELNNTSGSISGQMKVGGTLKKPDYEGNFHFDNSTFTVAKLGAAFTFPDETIRIDSTGIYMEDFDILDQNNNKMMVDGAIFTKTLLNPSFDLQLTANDFTALNSTEEDFDLFYGTASFDAEAHLTGDLNVPVLDLRLDVGPDTDVTYIIPSAELDVVERDGIVIFVNRENPDAILTQTAEEESVIITGFEVNSIISVDEDAIFNIVLDKETEDNFQVSGEGDLNFNVYSNGRTTLSGRYEMSDGYYEMSLYGLVNRRFDIAPGSSITWAGDPFDANLDIRAIYEVETSASSLMATQTSGASAGVSGRFRQELPFLVYLNVDGDLMHPKISFNIDMPEDEQGAVGGQVYGRIQQLNQQENELNKQVFSLLVMNRFFPQSMTDGSSGGTLTIARDNLNQALSDQLNMFSNQVLGNSGVKLNFAVDSFTDYQGASPEERTQLDITAEKSLMNDRLIVRVGSEVDIQGSTPVPGESSPVIGNVSIEYLLTEEGKLRLKAFRKNQYENVIDGQLVVTGIALIFMEEFNKFKELWHKAAVEETSKNTEK